MGIFQGFLRVGLVILALLGTLGMAAGPVHVATDDEDEDSSSGRWEGVAMARLEAAPAKISVT